MNEHVAFLPNSNTYFQPFFPLHFYVYLLLVHITHGLATYITNVHRWQQAGIQPPILTISWNLAIVAKLGDPEFL